MSTNALLLHAEISLVGQSAVFRFGAFAFLTCGFSFGLTYLRFHFFCVCNLTFGLSQTRLHPSRGSVWDPGVQDTLSWATRLREVATHECNEAALSLRCHCIRASIVTCCVRSQVLCFQSNKQIELRQHASPRLVCLNR